MCKLILLPGMDGSGLLFKPLLNELSCDTQVLPLSLEEQTYRHQLDKIINTIGDEAVVLFAESYSGYLAYLLAQLKPKNIKHVIFAASFLTNPIWMARLYPLLPFSLLKKKWIPAGLVNQICFNQLAGPELIELFHQSLQTASDKILRYRLKNIACLPKIPSSIQTPCTYILPTNDYFVSQRAVRQLINTCENIEVKSLVGGHFIAQSNPVECGKIIKDVMAGV